MKWKNWALQNSNPLKATELNATEDISMIGVIDAGMEMSSVAFSSVTLMGSSSVIPLSFNGYRLRSNQYGVELYDMASRLQITQNEITVCIGSNLSVLPGVIVTLTGQDRQVTTDANGNFILRNLQPGSHVIQLNSVLITPKSVTIEVEKLGVTELEPIKVTELNATEDISMIGVIDAGMVDDDVENASQDAKSTVIL